MQGRGAPSERGTKEEKSAKEEKTWDAFAFRARAPQIARTRFKEVIPSPRARGRRLDDEPGRRPLTLTTYDDVRRRRRRAYACVNSRQSRTGAGLVRPPFFALRSRRRGEAPIPRLPAIEPG